MNGMNMVITLACLTTVRLRGRVLPLDPGTHFHQIFVALILVISSNPTSKHTSSNLPIPFNSNTCV